MVVAFLNKKNCVLNDDSPSGIFRVKHKRIKTTSVRKVGYVTDQTARTLTSHDTCISLKKC